MIEEVVHCDRCKVIIPYAHVAECFSNRVSLRTGGYTSDVAGGPGHHDTKDLDLCRGCVTLLAREMAKILPEAEHIKLLSWFIKKKV